MNISVELAPGPCHKRHFASPSLAKRVVDKGAAKKKRGKHTDAKQLSGWLGRIKLMLRWALDLVLSPYRWLFPQELFWGGRKPNSPRPPAAGLPHVRSMATSSRPSADFVEHSPSWSRAELFGQTLCKANDRRLSFKLSQLLAAANEPSSGSYCLRNRLLTLADIPFLPEGSFPLPRRPCPSSPSSPSPPLSAPKDHTITLVLDLDETLVYTTSESSGTCGLIAEVAQVERSRGPPLLYYVHKRPYLDRFLSIVREWYRLAVYTASRAEYASIVCDWLDPRGSLFGSRRLFRDSCFDRDGVFMKDLQLIEPDLARVCLLDNSPCSFLLCPDNGIPISGWTSGPDRALLQLLPLLDALRFTGDVRSVLSLRRLM